MYSKQSTDLRPRNPSQSGRVEGRPTQPTEFKTQISFGQLSGKGVEFGAMHKPLPVDQDKAHVLYADRLSREQALVVFPELKDLGDFFIEPDLIVDCNNDDLSSLAQHEFDFYIANHFIEHLVNPVRFLKNLSDVMKPGSVLFLTVPDKEYTFDRGRELTTNDHLWNDYLTDERTLSNAHLREFLRRKQLVSEIHPNVVKYFNEHGLPLSYYNGNKLPWNPAKRKKLYEFHRERSIHVHVWNVSSFDRFLRWINTKLKLEFEIEFFDGDARNKEEMIYVLKKTSEN